MMLAQIAPVYEFPVLLLGAGRGGSAVLEMFLDDRSVQVIGVVDANPAAFGRSLAWVAGIPTFDDVESALDACANTPGYMIYNLTGDESIATAVKQRLGDAQRVVTGSEARMIWQMVTNVKHLKNELERSQNHLQAIIHHVLDGIVTVDKDGVIRGFNPAAEKLFGMPTGQALGLIFMSSLIAGEGCEDARRLRRCIAGDESVSRNTLVLRGLRAGASEFPLEVSVSGMTIDGSRFFTLIARDITERKKVEEHLTYLAHHDFLTGLPNRALFLDRLACALSIAKRSGNALAVLFIDLDGFKAVNDTHGHDAGDTVLQVVAQRLRKVIRTSDNVARLGGDEFTVLLNHVGSHNSAEIVAEKILQLLLDPIELGSAHMCDVGASIGISLYEGGEVQAEHLLKQADSAMYQAKLAGKNTWRAYCENPQSNWSLVSGDEV